MSTHTHREALERLHAAAREVSILGAQPGRQWTRLTTAMLHAEVALSRPEPQAGEAKLREALQRLVDAEDRYVRETGMVLDDPIADAVKHARAALSAEQKVAK